MFISPVHDVVPEDGRDSWMRQDVGIADHHLVIRENPVPLGAARVMVVNESHSIAREPTDEPWRLAVAVSQPPELGETAGFLQDALRGEIESGGLLARGVHPVDQGLPMLVLVVTEAMVVIVHVRPQLPHCPRGVALGAVLSHELGPVALHKVKAPPVESDLQAKPSKPNVDAILHLGVPVVDVWSSVEAAICFAGSVHAAPVGILVPEGDGPAAPVAHPRKAWPTGHSARELIPPAILVLLVATPVVDHNVCKASDSVLVALFQQRLQGRLCAILGPIKIEELGRQVALRGHGLRARWKPNVCDPHLVQHLDLLTDDSIPVAAP
mmetsp:Transcript_29084/g.54528  ORF Transcript_29084/g.54528 Transcript_29084/m.54528 type:complete len:325 (+) Transcript_29084:602-1576(+)